MHSLLVTEYVYIHLFVEVKVLKVKMSSMGAYGPPPPPPPNFWKISGMQKHGGLDPTKPLIGVAENATIG